MTLNPLDNTRTRRIRALNDQLRQNPLAPALGQLVITPAVLTFLQSEPDLVPRDWLARYLFLLRALADFNDFGPENDPAQEHAFALFEVWDRRFFFRIDAYDTAGAHASPDPADPARTRRVLTIGFPENS